ncbi:hypothetical protein [Streptosporangium sandarakinum]|uniref:hypothetical protein n=2 Tax=Streptosporangiaceae TaxID=2004 RepID=UPI0037B49307
MKASSAGRRGVPSPRLAAGAPFMLLIVIGCGAGVLGNDRPAPERVTVTVTAGAPETTRTTEPGRHALVARSGTAKTGPYSFQIVRAD